MRFADPLYLLLLPLVALALWWRLAAGPRFKAALRFSATSLFQGLSPRRAEWRLKGPLFFRGIALALLVAALARPQRAAGRNETSANVTDIMICLDASQSMTSVDFQPKDRFSVAREVAKNFVLGRQYDRIGLVVFGRIAMTQCPLTLDYNALINAINAVHIGTVPTDHTAIGDALLTAVNRLKNSAARSKIIILATDGDNNAGMVDPLTAAKTAAAFDIRIYTIGVGVPGQGKIPVDDPIYGKRLVPIEDDLDEPSLQRIALTTGGRYFRATSSGALESIFRQIDQLEKTEVKVKEFIDYEELFRPLALAAFLALVCERVLWLTVARVLP
jgi:Ca-activated chloride channel family protein